MKHMVCLLLQTIVLLVLPPLAVRDEAQPQTAAEPVNFEFVSGQWFNGMSFERRTMHSVNGQLTSRRPGRIDRTLDLEGTWIVPPFAEAHNHNITGIEARDRPAIQKYLSDGVFYVKIQGNLPLTDETKGRLSLNRPEGVDVAVAQGSLTATGGHPIPLAERVLLALEVRLEADSRHAAPVLGDDDRRTHLHVADTLAEFRLEFTDADFALSHVPS